MPSFPVLRPLLFHRIFDSHSADVHRSSYEFRWHHVWLAQVLPNSGNSHRRGGRPGAGFLDQFFVVEPQLSFPSLSDALEFGVAQPKCGGQVGMRLWV